MKQPEFLKKGDRVAIVCTARKFTREDAQPAIDLLESWELQAVLGNTIGLDNHQLGGSDEERAADLQKMMDDPEIKAIWIARGGYGTVRIIDRIDFSNFIKNPKWMIGFSDITVLHSHLNTLGVQSIHGMMPFSVPTTAEISKETLHNALFGKSTNYTISSSPQNKTGVGKGALVGGNLSIIYSLLGSKSSIDTKGKILFLEDLDEYLYHIDRMFYNLKRNGYFEHLNGLIIGGMTDMHDNSIPFGYDAQQIILEICKEYDFPICFDFPAGHLTENRALIFGKNVTLDVSKNNVTLNFDGNA